MEQASKGTCSLFLLPAATAGAQESLAWISCLASSQFLCLEKAKNPGQYQIYSTQCGAVVPFWGEDLSTRDHWMQLPWRWQADSRTSYFGVTVFSKSFWPTTSFRQYFPPTAPHPNSTLCPFPSPDSSLLLLSLPYFCPLLLREWHQEATGSLPSASETMLPLAGNGSLWWVTTRGGRGLPHAHCADPGPAGSPW